MAEISPIRAICMISSPSGIEPFTPARSGFMVLSSTLASCGVAFGGVPFPLAFCGEFEATPAALLPLLCDSDISSSQADRVGFSEKGGADTLRSLSAVRERVNAAETGGSVSEVYVLDKTTSKRPLRIHEC